MEEELVLTVFHFPELSDTWLRSYWDSYKKAQVRKQNLAGLASPAVFKVISCVVISPISHCRLKIKYHLLMFTKLFHDVCKPVKSRWKKYFLSFWLPSNRCHGTRSYLKSEQHAWRNKRVLCEKGFTVWKCKIDILWNVVKKKKVSVNEMMILIVFLCVHQDVGS